MEDRQQGRLSRRLCEASLFARLTDLAAIEGRKDSIWGSPGVEGADSLKGYSQCQGSAGWSLLMLDCHSMNDSAAISDLLLAFFMIRV
jgi:hypothetical protein